MKTIFLTIILFVISITLPFASYAETEHYSFAYQLGKPASIEEIFESPMDSAVDSDGNVYVIGAASIQKFSSDGKFIAKLNDPYVRPFIEPRGIAIDSKDNVYVIDSHNSRILKYVNNGKTMAVFASDKINADLFSYPIKITIDSKDNVYVADHSLKIIQKFSSEGNLTEWGPNNSKDAQFENISGIAIDSKDNVYVADQGYLRNDKGDQTSQHFSRVQKFTNNGQLIEKWGLTGLGDGQISNTVNIDVDSDGNVYVADLDNSRIQKFTNNGIFISKFENKDGQLGNISNPSSITVDPNSGNLYVTNIGDNNVLKFSPDGTYLTEWGGIINRDGQLFATSDVVADSVGNVCAIDSVNNAIQKFSPEGKFLTKWGGYGLGNVEFIGPSKIAVDLYDNVYVVDQNNIRKFSPEGKFLAKWGSEGTDDGQISTLSGIAIDSHGNVYVADSYNHRVQKFTNDGKFLTKWGSEGSGNGQFVLPRDIAVDLDDVYVVDSFNNQIQKFSSKGEFLTKWGNKDVVYEPKGITTDLDNNIFVIHGEGISKFSKEGKLITQFRATDNKNIQFTSPSGITVDHDGNVYVSDGNAYALGKGVLKFTKDNTQSDIQTIPVSEKITSQDYASPSKQFKSGMSIEEIKCKDSLVLIKKYDGSPACVTLKTIPKLIERNWMLTDDVVSESSRLCNTIPDAGLCKAAIEKYYFNWETNSCMSFTWGGCGGTVPFDDIELCQKLCN